MDRTLDPARLGDHLDRLYRAAWALSGSREDAEDLLQQTYARDTVASGGLAAGVIPLFVDGLLVP